MRRLCAHVNTLTGVTIDHTLAAAAARKHMPTCGSDCIRLIRMFPIRGVVLSCSGGIISKSICAGRSGRSSSSSLVGRCADLHTARTRARMQRGHLPVHMYQCMCGGGCAGPKRQIRAINKRCRCRCDERGEDRREWTEREVAADA